MKDSGELGGESVLAVTAGESAGGREVFQVIAQ
jgi:hypothetical protein